MNSDKINKNNFFKNPIAGGNTNTNIISFLNY